MADHRRPDHPLRRPKDYRPDGTRRRRWLPVERKYRLSYRRRPVATVLSTVAAVVASSAIAYGSVRVESIFSYDPNLSGSGWQVCSTPISWTTDMRNVPADKRQAYRADIAKAFATWGQTSGYTFTDAGEMPIRFDDAQSLVTPVADINHNISVYFAPDSESTMLTKTVVGFAGPSKVFVESREIVGGYVVLSTDYLQTVNPKKRTALATHEIGHALGLADSDDSGNVMYRIVKNKTVLGDGDAAGIKAIIKPCAK